MMMVSVVLVAAYRQI